LTLVSEQCEDFDNLCFPLLAKIIKYLNRKDIQKELGVNSSLVPSFEACSEKVGEDFSKKGDELTSTTAEVIYLLDKGIPVLIYAGEYDWIWYHPQSISLELTKVTGLEFRIG
jgi:cathepsin A (carboxypeptidase C)